MVQRSVPSKFAHRLRRPGSEERQMAGSIRKRGKSTWELAFETGSDSVTAKRKRRYQSVKGTKKEAEQALTAAMSRYDRGTDIVPDKVTLAEFLNRWLADYADFNVVPSTAQRYRIAISKHISPHVGSLLLSRLRPLHIQQLHATCMKEGLSARTVTQHHRIVSEALKHAVQWQLLFANPAASISAPRFERLEMKTFDKDEIQRLLAAAEGTYLHDLIYLALHTGARSGELLALRWSDIDFEHSRLAIRRTVQRITGQGVVFGQTKNHRSRRAITLSPEASAFLQERRKRQLSERQPLGLAYFDQDLVFAQPLGQPYEPGQVSRAFPKLLERAGLRRIRFHDLRHTTATMLLSAGIHAKVVSERLGHATINITLDTYSHVLPDLQEEAAAAMDAVLKTVQTDGSPKLSNLAETA